MLGFRPVSTEKTATEGKGGAQYVVDSVFGNVLAKDSGPQVFLVHQAPEQTTHPHYHHVPQFQVFTGGTGSFGRKEVAVPTVHYADAYTTYGPIVSGSDGIDYFTARINSDRGAHYMPESKAEKTTKSGRHFTFALEPAAAPGSSILIEPQDDGLAAWDITLGAGQSVEVPRSTGAGRLVTVMAGSLVDDDGGEFGQGAWGNVSPDGAGHASAGRAGARILCLDFPLPPASSQAQ